MGMCMYVGACARVWSRDRSPCSRAVLLGLCENPSAGERRVCQAEVLLGRDLNPTMCTHVPSHMAVPPLALSSRTGTAFV